MGCGSSLTGVTALVLVQPRNTRPEITEKIVDREVKNQIKYSKTSVKRPLSKTDDWDTSDFM